MTTEPERFDRAKCSCKWDYSSGKRGPLEVVRDVEPRIIKFDANCEEKGKPDHPVDFGV